MSGFEDKKKFLNENFSELKPVLGDEGKQIAADIESGAATPEEIDAALEKFETKVFIREKSKEESPQGENVLIAFADPGSYAVMKPLIAKLESDPRARAIEVVAHGTGGGAFERDEREQFRRIQDREKLVLQDVGEMAETRPDIVLGTFSSSNGPESVLLYNAKTVFGANKLYVISDGWQSGKIETKNMDAIDGIFCNDELAKRMIARMLPGFSAEKIFPTGTPQLDDLEVDKAREYEAAGRQKLGVADDEILCQYNGGIESEWAKVYGTDPALEENTFARTVSALATAARTRPEQKFALYVRPHPRDPDKDRIYAEPNALPSNLHLLHGALSPNEASYASDAIVGVVTSEVFAAPLRGRTAAFLEFDAKQEGKTLDRIYGSEVGSAIRDSGERTVINTDLALKKFFEDLTRGGAKQSAYAGGATDNILDIVFADAKHE